MYKLFMEIYNPTDSFAGKRLSVQGFAVYNRTVFILYHTGICWEKGIKNTPMACV